MVGKSFDSTLFCAYNHIMYHKIHPYIIVPTPLCADIFNRNYLILNDMSISGINLDGIFDLSNILSPNTDTRFTLLHFSKRSTTVKIGNYRGNCCNKTESSKAEHEPLDSFITPDICERDFLLYLDNLQKWINGHRKPKCTHNTDYNVISNSYVFNYITDPTPSPRDYSSTATKIHKLFNPEQITSLNQMATIYSSDEKEPPNDMPKGLVRCFRNNNHFADPLTNMQSFFSTQSPGNIRLQKGDIVIEYEPSMQIDLIYKDSDDIDNVYCTRTSVVIRPNAEVSSEYLYLYLTSDVKDYVYKKKIDYDRDPKDENNPVYLSFQELRPSDLKSFPVINRQFPKSVFEKFFNTQFFESDYGDVLECLNITINEIYKDSMEAVLINELKSRIRNYWCSRVRRVAEFDYEEMKKCYYAQSYKSAIIMAGSVLEAFIIDWYSELTNRDYFQTYYKKINFEESLKNYIERLSQALLPDNWENNKIKATRIREYRNYVHPKRFMKDHPTINKDKCDMIFKYLKDIIDSRYYAPFPIKTKHN